jgi:rifampicin phosphotransferase
VLRSIDATLARTGVDRLDIVYVHDPDEYWQEAADGAMPTLVERAWVLAHPGPRSYGKDPGPPPSFSSLPAEARLANDGFLWAVDRIFGPDTTGRVGPDGAVTGIAASPGSYTGPVRVIMNETEFGRLRAGDVLVCPVTSPVWSVLFPSIGALVTDVGGNLSHPAIIAREYGVPACDR